MVNVNLGSMPKVSVDKDWQSSTPQSHEKHISLEFGVLELVRFPILWLELNHGQDTQLLSSLSFGKLLNSGTSELVE